jgi:hypothetical protein
MRSGIMVSLMAAGILGAVSTTSWGEEEKEDAAALAKALPEATVALDQGLTASEREGKPISGKYEIEDGALQLSIYTAKGNGFSEVIVDHKTGAVKKADKITDGDDLKSATEQNAAMAKAKVPLGAAVASAVKANGGYRAVSVVPVLNAGQPVANVTLMKGRDIKEVIEKLD